MKCTSCRGKGVFQETTIRYLTYPDGKHERIVARSTFSSGKVE